jgi:hypothetical protein
MNDDKFASFGKKLNVDSATLANKNQGIWAKKVGFFLMQVLALAVSSVFGLFLGFTEHRYQGAYPFNSMSGLIGLAGLIGIDTFNWKRTAKRDAEVGVSLPRGVKIPIVLVNMVFSLVGYLALFSLTASSDNLTNPMLYGVYTKEKEEV